MSSAQHVARTARFRSTVSDVVELSPRMRRITLAAPEIAGQDWPLGCDVAVILAGSDGRELRRRYTVRRTRGSELVIDALLHGHGPGSTWAERLGIGDPALFAGPRGSIPLEPTADLLAVTDESGLPAVACVAESALAQGCRTVRVLAEVADDAETYPLPDTVQVEWILRSGRTAGSPELLNAAVRQMFDTAVSPRESDYAYVLGESRAVVAIRDELVAGGLSRGRIYAKGYWNLNARPTR